ncbi:nitroreductase family protein [Paraburkholderia ginsengisoli]|uniref:Putative NAD(P)H nitroreductase n=1 Tax=Paraburkholderia ginsengisoli TaxID=311231 RepID=A0A7T4N745_9BURK|nr:nitroreductase [Paraburkholderia ginsengisoli]QQC66449.1 nitroreductase [Paraburkholderia ginsengisoli]
MTMLDLSLADTKTDTKTAHPTSRTATPAAAAALDVLLSRQSHWPLTEPGPLDTELELIVDAALRAPDHGNLRPWRFVTIRGDARGRLGDLLVDLACARAPDEPRSAHAHRRQKAFAAPLVIALGAALTAHPKVPEVEQLLAAGAAAMNMLNAIHALGYGGFWSTGPDCYEAYLHDALGFAPNERMLGFLFVGTPKTPGQAPARPSRNQHVREWRPPQPA